VAKGEPNRDGGARFAAGAPAKTTCGGTKVEGAGEFPPAAAAVEGTSKKNSSSSSLAMRAYAVFRKAKRRKRPLGVRGEL
jgi:ketosteroid isomerase-like protein